ncbi:unnamed protein product [Tilletia laevis]|uniref:Peptidase A1 domain-containing protein n=2 Tax=Tilletia TaxID=13289 RepID=A0A9N8MAL2_9BASI|nr:hypothetical protein CF336_g7257 [Tilletia laevis]CAD6963289.1 unnamed protein product [Tilletia laevis]CAD7066333.1 unnamed protein product [Tilletia caries]
MMLSLSKRNPVTASAKVAAGGEDNVATVSEKEPFAIGSAYVSRLRVKYANRFDNFKANTGKSNGVDTRTDSAQVDAASDTGSEPLVDQQDELLWVGQVGVGTPAQTVTLDFDTGSSDTWVSPSIYKPTASSSAKKTGKTFRGAHGDNIYLESRTVGGLTAVKQAFGTAIKSTVQDTGSQGIAGMSFKTISDFNGDPIFDTLVQQGTAPQNVFAFGLWPKGTRLDIGHIAKEAYQGKVTYSPVQSAHGFL